MLHLVPALLLVPFVQTHLQLEVSVAYTPPSLQGTATLTIENATGEPQAAVPLLLNRLMTISAARDQTGGSLVVSSDVVIFDDEPMWQVLAARVTLAQPVAPGQRTTIHVDFAGPLVGYAETGMLYVKDRIDPAFTILRADALAFPTLGVPSVAANRAAAPPLFGFEARVTVPRGQVVATGGTLRETLTRGERLTFVYEGARIPFLNIAIAPFARVERGGVRVFALPEDAERAAPLAEAAERAFAWFAATYGALPDPPTITIVEIPQGFGSQASATGGVLLDAAAFRDRSQLTQLYHEVSHLWNVPDRDVPSPRWNEGLATYLQYRVAAALDGFAEMDAARERTRVRVCAAVKEGQPVASVPFAQYGAKNMTDWSYRVGFLMFSELERLAGRERVDTALREYIRKHLASGGSTRDLAAAIDAHVERDLRAFVDEWMFTTAWTRSQCGGSEERPLK